MRSESKDDLDARKIRQNGEGRFYVSVPPWWALDSGEIFNAQLVFEKHDGKRSVRILVPSTQKKEDALEVDD